MNPILSEWLTQPGGLAARLHALRVAAGISSKDLAARLGGWDPSKVSKLEHGRQMPTHDDITAWARECGAAAGVEQELLDLLGESHAMRVTFRQRLRSGQVAVQESYRVLSDESYRFRQFHTVYVPGPLQIPEYARRVLFEGVGLHELDTDDVEQAVAVRLQRQQQLYDTSRRFEFLLAEPVLRWRLCPSEVMLGQLDRLLTLAALSNVRFGILPFGVPLATAPQNSFELFDDVAIVETFVGETVYGEAESAAYARVMDRLWVDAVEGDEARALIVRVADELRRGGDVDDDVG